MPKSTAEALAELSTRHAGVALQAEALMTFVIGEQARLAEVREEIDELAEAIESGTLGQGQHAEALEVLQGLETAFTHGFEQAVGAIISRGLTLVREEPWRFRIAHKLRGDVSAVEFLVTDPSGHETDVLESHGGGLSNLIDFLLRVLVILNSRPAMRKFLWLDESFSAISEEFVPATAELLRQFVDTLGLQIVLTTHIRAFADVADIVHLVEQKPRGSFVRMIKARGDLVA